MYACDRYISSQHYVYCVSFYLGINSFLPAQRYASAGLCDSDVSVCLSVRPSVCHTPVLCQAEQKQDREMYTT